MTRWLVVALVLLATILIPFFLFEARFNALAADLTRGEGPRWYVAAIVALLLTADVVLPIPSSIVSAGAGVSLGFWLGAVTIWIGMTLGCVVGYVFGARGSSAARRFVGEARMTRADGLWERFGDYAIVLSRPVPVLAEASVIFAGVVHRPFGHFLALSTLSNLGVALGYAAIGAFSMRLDSFLLAFAGSLALPGLAMLAARLWLPQTR